METFVEDPAVLDAALQLVDEWYDAVEKGDVSVRKATPQERASSSDRGRKRAREDLASLRSSVHELHRRSRKRLEPLPVSVSRGFMTESDGHTTEESSDDGLVLTKPVAVQARRLLQAIHSYNRLHAAVHVSLSMIERSATGPTDTQILSVFSSRLDSLTAIARATRLPSALGKNDDANEMSFSPNCFRGRINGTVTYPFKLSIVADVMWELVQLIRLGPEKKPQLSVRRPNEAIAMLTTNVNTPSGYMAAQGVTALRRVHEDDGSVLLMHSMISTSPSQDRQAVDKTSSPRRPNLLAGCTIKQAGWTRLRLDRGPGRPQPLVLMEKSVGIVIEASPGCSVSQERLQLILRMLGEMRAAEERSPQWLENRLMDASLAGQKRRST